MNRSLNIQIGHTTDHQSHTGCTVFLLPENASASVDARGLSPGSRELALLSPIRRVETINAIVFTGGSAFGLATADGVMQYLSERQIGHPTPIRRIPIVAASVVYDLFLGKGKRLPDAGMGYQACEVASADNSDQGNIGAGAGATVGKWAGFNSMMKGGFGLAEVEESEVIVQAAAVVNSVGDIVAPNGSVLAGAYDHKPGHWLVEKNRWRYVPATGSEEVYGTNTVLALVATNTRLSKIEAHRLAQIAHNGLAIAVRYAHTTRDGDTCYAVSTNEIDAPFEQIANMVVDVVAEAIRNGVRAAATVGAVPGLAG